MPCQKACENVFRNPALSCSTAKEQTNEESRVIWAQIIGTNGCCRSLCSSVNQKRLRVLTPISPGAWIT
mgnify:FL=1